MFKNFRGYMAQLLHGKTVVCSVYSKILRHYKKRLLQKILFFRGIRSQKVFLRKLGKYLYRSLYLMKLLVSSLQLY